MLKKIGIVCAALLCFGCEAQAPLAPKPVEPAPVVAAPVGPAMSEALAMSQSGVLGAQRLAMRDAIPAMSQAAGALAAPKRELGFGGRPGGPLVFTFIATSNMHGEREDCGCKANPLGGLTRHATLTELAKTPAAPDAVKYWGQGLEVPTALLRVDAGDALFRSASLMEWSDDQKKQHMKAAEAVIAGLNAAPPDVMNVGELDLALGWEALSRLKAGAKFPLISANLRLKDGSSPLPASAIVTRGAHKIAFVGLLKEQSLIPDYWSKRGVAVGPAGDAYVAAVKALPADVSLVVMLSNLGVADTERLIVAVRGAGARVDAAFISNTNSLSPRPLWPAGVPMVEAMSRGKHIGRLDLLLNQTGEQPIYANARQDPNEAIQDYGRKVGLYLETRGALRELERQRAELERKQPAGADALSADVRAANSARLATLDADILRTAQSAANLGQDVAAAGLKLEQAWAAPSGGAEWADWRAVQVKLDIPQHPAVRKVLDKNKVEGL